MLDTNWESQWEGERKSVAQCKDTRSQEPKLSMSLTYCQAWSPNGSVKVCALYKNPSDETINKGPLCVYTCKNITYTIKTKRSCSRCQSLVDYGSNKITQHALKVEESSSCWSWTLHERRWRTGADEVLGGRSRTSRRLMTSNEEC